MLPYNVHRKVRGFTLTEMLATMIIAGVLFAVATPSFLGWFNNSKVKSGLEQLQGALTEAQRQAMRKGKICSVTIETKKIDGESRDVITFYKPESKPPYKYSGCLLSDRILPKGVILKPKLNTTSPPRIEFSLKGNTRNGGTIVVSMSDDSGEKRCLVISPGLGIMRTGIYNGDTSSITSDNCTTSD